MTSAVDVTFPVDNAKTSKGDFRAQMQIISNELTALQAKITPAGQSAFGTLNDDASRLTRLEGKTGAISRTGTNTLITDDVGIGGSVASGFGLTISDSAADAGIRIARGAVVLDVTVATTGAQYSMSSGKIHRWSIGGTEVMSITSAGVLDLATGTSGGILTDAQSLPTSDPSVTGRLWNDGGTVKVS